MADDKKKKKRKPINVSPLTRAFFAAMPQINAALANQSVTVDEAIDLAANITKKVTAEMGISDRVIAITDNYKE